MEIKVITKSEFSLSFHQGMVDRMEVSFHKYGKVQDAVGKIDNIACLEKRLSLYKETGNTEWLMDVANFAMIEFMQKGKDKFRATDTDESPGLIYKNGNVSSAPHTPTDTQKNFEIENFYKRVGD